MNSTDRLRSIQSQNQTCQFQLSKNPHLDQEGRSPQDFAHFESMVRRVFLNLFNDTMTTSSLLSSSQPLQLPLLDEPQIDSQHPREEEKIITIDTLKKKGRRKKIKKVEVVKKLPIIDIKKYTLMSKTGDPRLNFLKENPDWQDRVKFLKTHITRNQQRNRLEELIDRGCNPGVLMDLAEQSYETSDIQAQLIESNYESEKGILTELLEICSSYFKWAHRMVGNVKREYHYVEDVSPQKINKQN